MKNLIENFSDNVEIQVMAKKIREIVEWITEHKKQDFQEPIVICGEPLRKKKDSLGDTLPEEKESIDNCYLTTSDEEEGGGYLVCSYNHKIGEKCLMDEKECKDEYYECSKDFCEGKHLKHTLPEEKRIYADIDGHTIGCPCSQCILQKKCSGYNGSVCSNCKTYPCECEPKHNHSRGEAGCGECAKKEKELFDMVYIWGKVGIVTDEKCNAFQDLLKEIKNL